MCICKKNKYEWINVSITKHWNYVEIILGQVLNILQVYKIEEAYVDVLSTNNS